MLHENRASHIEISVITVCFNAAEIPVRVPPARRGRGSQHTPKTDREDAPTPVERRAGMTWAQLFNRVFGIDIQTCAACGRALRVIACIEDSDVIEKAPTHLDKQSTEPPGPWPPPCRGAAAARFVRPTGMTPRRLSGVAPPTMRPRRWVAGVRVKSALTSLSLRQMRAP